MERKGYITASDLFSMIAARDKMVILDTRQVSDYEEYHVSGAVRVEAEEISNYLEGSAASAKVPVIVISERDEPSDGLSRGLYEKGYNAFYLKGGMEEGWFRLVRHIRIHEQK